MKTGALSVLLCALLALACSNDNKAAGIDAGPGPDLDTDTDTECSPEEYQQCGADGNVHWYDSCDVEGPVAEDCPDQNAECVNTSATDAECVCLNHWIGDECDQCPEGWDPEQHCDECAPGWNGDDCADLCVRYVDIDAPVGGVGDSWAGAFRAVQDGVNAAADTVENEAAIDSCQVWVAEGTYYIHVSSVMDTIQLQPGVHVYGGFAGTETELADRNWVDHISILDGCSGSSCDFQARHVVLGADSSTLDGFRIVNGYANGDASPVVGGGGMRIEDCSPTVRNCSFEDNYGWWGGGILVLNGSPIVRSCSFQNNLAATAGGAMFIGDGSPLVDGVVFEGNDILSTSDYLTGGGVCSVGEDSNPLFVNSVFWGNGHMGLAYFSGAPEIVNCTFYNTASAGCDIWLSVGSTPLSLHNSIVQGKGIVCGDADDIPIGYPTCYGCGSSNPLTMSYSSIIGSWAGPGVFDGNPLFLDADGGDLRLSIGSPCIDAADGDLAPATDIDGTTRIDDPDSENTGIGPPWADIGAYELVP